MKKIKTLLFVSMLSTLLSGCNEVDNSVSSTNDNIDSLSSSLEESSTPMQDNSSENSSIEDNYQQTQFFDIKDIVLEKNDKIEITNVITVPSNFELKVSDENIAIFEDYYILGKEAGTTTFTITRGLKRQTVKLTVIPSPYPEVPYIFPKENLEGKNMVVFGDSVTAVSTIGNAQATYSYRFASHYKMNLVKNYAIGGTTATYTFPGSNIYKEYSTNPYVKDGCQVVYNAYINNELNNIDYAFIAYGHNDQYFKPAISTLNDREYCVDNTYFSCKSYKGSYRYMINVLRKANPNMRIVLLNCTYSEYDKNNNPAYGKRYSYYDYRYATMQIAAEMNCKYIDPWDYMKKYYDYGKGNVYYSDVVHITAQGHKILADYLINQ